jgi:hypothetical protein
LDHKENDAYNNFLPSHFLATIGEYTYGHTGLHYSGLQELGSNPQTQRQQGNLIFQNQKTRLRINEVHISSLFIPGVRKIWSFLHRCNPNAKSSHSNCNTEVENNINAESNANAVSDMGM